MSRSDEGSIVLFFAALTSGLLSLVAMASFGSRITLGAQSEAIRTANSAARAGAQVLDPRAYRQGTVRLDAEAARAAANDYLAATGHAGSVAVEGDRVVVTVTVVRRVPFFNLSYTAKGVGAARLAAAGVSG